VFGALTSSTVAVSVVDTHHVVLQIQAAVSRVELTVVERALVNFVVDVGGSIVSFQFVVLVDMSGGEHAPVLVHLSVEALTRGVITWKSEQVQLEVRAVCVVLILANLLTGAGRNSRNSAA